MPSALAGFSSVVNVVFNVVFVVAFELLREALHRRWLLAIFGLITLAGLVLAFTLKMDVGGGVLSGTSLFGMHMDLPLQATDVALRPLLVALGFGSFLLGVPFGAFACADLAPAWLAPGRVEHLLSLPVRRSEWLAGTYLGVMFVAMLGSCYAALILTVLVGIKASVWSAMLLGGAASACVAFSAVYGAMLLCTVLVRSTGLAAAVGVGLFFAGTLLTRPGAATFFEPGVKRSLFVAAIAPLPRLWQVAELGPMVSGFAPFDASVARTAAGTLLFGVACVMLAIWHFERQDY